MEQYKAELRTHLANYPWLTVTNLSRRLNVSRKLVRYILSRSPEFAKFDRNPINTVWRRRPVWCLKEKLPQDASHQH